jgi:hypothetical protein
MDLTPRFMRRTFQHLCRAPEVHDFVTRATSGHATAAMQEHYSSVDGDEVRAGLAKLISLAGFAQSRAGESGARTGDKSGDQNVDTATAETTKAANP